MPQTIRADHHKVRSAKARKLFNLKRNRFKATPRGWSVPSQQGFGDYDVRLWPHEWCPCIDHTNHGHSEDAPCTHIFAADMAEAKLKPERKDR